MDRNSNLYKAIENALINPLLEEVNALEPSEHEFSALYRKNIKRIIKEQKNWNDPKKAGSKKKIRMIILIAAAMIALGGITVAACEPLREWIVSLFVEEYDDHIKVKTFSGSEADFDVPELNELYEPAYIPDGYELQEEGLDSTMLYMIWINDDGNYVSYYQGLLDDITSINNENMTVKDIVINGNNAIISFDDENTIITWSDNKYMHQIVGIINKDEAILMAESLRPKK
ncbi:MAG TPA: hypothetical protein DCS12_08040 [Clostridiales bacterium]|nr:hypothetical protein [Clostridiales bacterium]